MTRVNIIDFIARKLKALVGIVQDTDTATVNIAKGKYVIWKGNPCKASSAISSGGTLSASNLTALTEGVGNDINSNINNIGSFNTVINENVSIGSSYASTGKTFTLTKASIVSVSQGYSAALPLAIGVKGSTSNTSPSFIYGENAGQDDNVAGLWAHGVLGAGTYYVWAKAKGNGGSNAIRVDVYQIKA